MKRLTLSITIFFSMIIMSIFNSAKPNRTRINFLNSNIFVFSHGSKLLAYNIQNKTYSVMYDSGRWNLLSDIFTDPTTKMLNVLVNCCPNVGCHIISLNPSIPRTSLTTLNLNKYEKNEQIFITRNGSFVATMNKLNNLEYYDHLTNTQKADYHFGKDEFRELDMTDDGSVIALNFYTAGKLYTLFMQKNQFRPALPKSIGLNGDYFFNFALSPNGEKLFSISSRGGEIWDIRYGKNELTFMFRWDENINNYQAYSWAKCFDKSLYYKKNMNLFYITNKVVGSINKAIFSEDSNRIFLIIKLEEGLNTPPTWKLKVFDIKNDFFINTVKIENLNGFVKEMAVSPDEKTLVIIDRDTNIITIPL